MSWSFQNLLKGPGPGVMSGTSPTLTYKTTGVPAGGHVLVQRGIVSGGGVKWVTVSEPQVAPLGTTTLIRPPFGRNAYRLAITDAHNKVLASAFRNLDVYRTFTLSQLTTRPVQSIKAGAFPFSYVFQAIINIPDTSCRWLSGVQFYNSGPNARVVEVSDTINGSTATSRQLVTPSVNGSLTVIYYYGRSVTPGEDFQIHILDNDLYGSTVYGGNATMDCFTDNGQV